MSNMTRREYLASKGLAIAGARGKFSNAAKEELARVVAEGMTFTDDATVKPAKPTGPVAPKPVPVPRPEVADYIFPSDYRFPEGEFKAVDKSGKVHDMRQACRCGYSLTNHPCDEPYLNAYGSVKIVPR